MTASFVVTRNFEKFFITYFIEHLWETTYFNVQVAEF